MQNERALRDLSIEAAVPSDLEILAGLFHDFRVFYDCAPDALGAKRFVEERLEGGPTRFFLARVAGDAAGFVHLMPWFDTLAMTEAWSLEDLFVRPAVRERGVGSALMRHAEAFARGSGAGRITLTTAHTNRVAQRLYERHGYVMDEIFRTYHLALA